jgi:hypothetical protein
MKHIVAALVFAAQGAFGQSGPLVESLDWMTGSWVSASSKETVRETWHGPANGMLVAVNLTSSANGRATYEFLRIARTPAGFSYFASPGGRTPVEFPMKEAGERRVVFENPSHDFPRRILYWRDGASLMARVEGTLRGETRSEEWRFERATTPD